MKIELSTGNTFPKKKEYYWQFVVLPTVSILKVKAETDYTEEKEEAYYGCPYTVIDIEWLFWSVAIVIK